MLQINRQTDYAVRVILALARQPIGTRLSSGEIQRQMLIPKAFLARIVAQLALVGLIRTFPGREGGLELSRPPNKISLWDVVQAFEGPIQLSECMESHGEDDCPFRAECPVRPKWMRAQIAMMRELASITFEDLTKDATVPHPA